MSNFLFVRDDCQSDTEVSFKFALVSIGTIKTILRHTNNNISIHTNDHIYIEKYESEQEAEDRIHLIGDLIR